MGMRKAGKLIFFLATLVILTGFPSGVFSSQVNSHAGISFTEEDFDEENEWLKEIENIPNTIGTRKSSKLPQTGFENENRLIVVGISLVSGSILIKQLQKRNKYDRKVQ